ncbi:transcriptional regulator LeuO [Vibrio ulleungensis]|uniref:Transcriptional regulator LeuO n=1 Tax=Vibrio ulleungensis TaxID=2807619 RepID=A0ABS2HIM2_9VIBR|nr:transcriptional regulator LeuO [Vibrio ulleungensis]MBM7037378.1 transcriptional regulator LeuO [Vibrio ulleungensis]
MNFTSDATKEQLITVETTNRSMPTLRGVDLNLLTVFDAVMQEQNITRAAKLLNMSQPAVSNAVSRLKIMFKDDLFLRYGRGIQPTQRAKQIFGPIRQALQLVKNELPDTEFIPQFSTRQFSVAIGQPNDVRLVGKVLRHIQDLAPNVELLIQTATASDIEQKLRIQEVDFVIDFSKPASDEYRSIELFTDQLVVLAAKDHPRVQDSLTLAQLQFEKHAQLTRQNGIQSFTQAAYAEIDCKAAYWGLTITNLGYVVSESELLTIVPMWVASAMSEVNPNLNILELPLNNRQITTYLSWHETAQQSSAHSWLKEQIVSIAKSKQLN